jgi:hypothetical protein
MNLWRYAKSLEGYEPKLELSISENMKVGKIMAGKTPQIAQLAIGNLHSKSTLPYLKKKSGENSLSLQDIPK